MQLTLPDAGSIGSIGRIAAPPDAFDYGALAPDDAAKLREVAESIRNHGRRIGRSIIAVGELLLAVKQGLPHGGFGAWLQAEFAWNERTAQRYMQAAEAFGSKTDTVSELPPTTIYQLSASSTPEQIRREVVRRLEQGERLSGDEIKSMVRRAKAAAKSARADAALTPEQRARRKQAEARQQHDLERRREESRAALSREVAARHEAAALIMERFGDDTQRLAELLDICRGVFASDLRPKMLSRHSAG